MFLTKPLKQTLHRASFEEMNKPLFEAAIEPIKQLLDGRFSRRITEVRSNPVTDEFQIYNSTLVRSTTSSSLADRSIFQRQNKQYLFDYTMKS